MAINQKPELPNLHTGYIAMSGYGKSQALKQNPDVPRRGVRVLLWDPDEDHQAHRFKVWNQLVRAVLAGIKSGQGFRIAWSGDVSLEIFNAWCRLVWQCLDGNVPTWVIIEELADVQPSAGKATQEFGELCRKGRKYGARLHWTSQRSQEVSKTVFDQTQIYYIGYPNDTAARPYVERLARIAGCPSGAEDLYALEPLQFWYRRDRESSLVTLQYKNL